MSLAKPMQEVSGAQTCCAEPVLGKLNPVQRGHRFQHLDRDGCADPHPLRRETPDQELCHRSRATIPAPRVRSIRSVR